MNNHSLSLIAQQISNSENEPARFLRISSIYFLRGFGMFIGLPELPLATSAYLYHYFATQNDIVLLPVEDLVQLIGTCVFLGAKIEETPRKLSDIVLSLNEYLKTDHPFSYYQAPCGMDWFHPDSCVSKILDFERKLLELIGFELLIPSPYLSLVRIGKTIGFPFELLREAWIAAHQSTFLNLALQFPVDHIMTAVLFILAQEHNLLLPISSEPPIPSVPWWQAFGISREDLDHIISQLIRNHQELTIFRSQRIR